MRSIKWTHISFAPISIQNGRPVLLWFDSGPIHDPGAAVCKWTGGAWEIASVSGYEVESDLNLQRATHFALIEKPKRNAK